MKLTKTQQELLDAMRTGVKVSYMPYAGRLNPAAYYYRSDNHRKCTGAANSLKDKGLVEIVDKKFGGSHQLRLKD